jgi:carboxyl-terminal processing protease
MEEAEQKKAKSTKLDTKINNKETGSDNLSSMQDEFLREGLLILSEIIKSRIG